MRSEEFTFSFNNSELDDTSVWLNARQEDLPIADEIANLQDVSSMLSIVSLGQSAHMYQKKDFNIEIEYNEDGTVSAFFTTLVYVFHSAGLQYNRSATYGELLTMTTETVKREVSVVIDFKSSVEIEFRAENMSIEFETPCFTRTGSVTAPPSYTITDNIIHFDSIVWAVIRVKGDAEADVHPLRIGNREGYNVEDFRSTVLFSYVDGKGQEQNEQVSIRIPQYIEDILSTCPEGSDNEGLLIRWRVDPFDDEKDYSLVEVYYYACTGQVFNIVKS